MCECCNKRMISGYEIRNEYFCSDDCLRGWYSAKEYDELCRKDRVKIIQEGGKCANGNSKNADRIQR